MNRGGTFLALASVGVLAVGAALRGSGSANQPTVADLERAFAQAQGSMNFGDGAAPKKLKPWEVFLRMDPADVPDDLVLAIVIGAARDPVEKARQILASVNGSVGQVVTGSFDANLRVSGAQKARVIAAGELARRAQVRQSFSTPDPVVITSPEAAVNLLQRLSTGPRERLSALYLSQNGTVVGYRVLSEGSRNATVVDPAEVFRPAVQLRASAVIMAHQHPSGEHKPSRTDISATQRLGAAGRVLGITMQDHLVLGADGRHTSMKALGII